MRQFATEQATDIDRAESPCWSDPGDEFGRRRRRGLKGDTPPRIRKPKTPAQQRRSERKASGDYLLGL